MLFAITLLPVPGDALAGDALIVGGIGLLMALPALLSVSGAVIGKLRRRQPGARHPG